MAGLLTVSPAIKGNAKDSDGDGMSNRWERSHGLNPNKKKARKDNDHDGLKNIADSGAT